MLKGFFSGGNIKYFLKKIIDEHLFQKLSRWEKNNFYVKKGFLEEGLHKISFQKKFIYEHFFQKLNRGGQ
jgi:hypothetical protein